MPTSNMTTSISSRPNGLPNPDQNEYIGTLIRQLDAAAWQLVHENQSKGQAIRSIVIDRDAALAHANKLDQERILAIEDGTKWMDYAKAQNAELKMLKDEMVEVKAKLGMEEAARKKAEGVVEALGEEMKGKVAEVDAGVAEVMRLEGEVEKAQVEQQGLLAKCQDAEAKLEGKAQVLALLRGCHVVNMTKLVEYKDRCLRKSMDAFLLRSWVEDAEEALGTAKGENVGLHEQLGNVEKALTDVRTEKEEVLQDSKQFAVAFAESERSRLQLEKEHRVALEKLKQDHELKLAELQLECDASQDMVYDLEMDKIRMFDEAIQAEKEHARLDGECSRLKGLCKQLIVDKAKVVGELQEAKDEITETRNQLENAITAGTEAKQTADALREQLATLTSKRGDMSAEVERLQTKLHEIGDARDAVAQQRDFRAQEVISLKKALQLCQTNIASIEPLHTQAVKDLAEEKHTLVEVRTELTSTRLQLQMAGTELTSTQQHLEDATAQRKKLAAAGRMLRSVLDKRTRDATVLSFVTAHISGEHAAVAAKAARGQQTLDIICADRDRRNALVDSARRGSGPFGHSSRRKSSTLPRPERVPSTPKRSATPPLPPPASRSPLPPPPPCILANAQLPSPSTPPAEFAKPVKFGLPKKGSPGTPKMIEVQLYTPPRSWVLTIHLGTPLPKKDGASHRTSTIDQAAPKDAGIPLDPRLRGRAPASISSAPPTLKDADSQKRKGPALPESPVKRQRVDGGS